MNLVGHNMALVEELKKFMIKRIEGFNNKGYIKEDKYEKMLDEEIKSFDERLETMREWL
ncbi:hypothetical protein [Paenibacillus sp. FSL E2-0178]|uniref:hypothetical protein n=1 Tax=Paenibacillus sp. FSL E2-0178 TaxID=2921361 RepID=UPI003158A970